MRDLFKISAGKIISALFSFIASIIIARKIGVSDFGLFTLSLSVAVITLELFGSEGMDNGLVRYGSLYIDSNANKAYLVFKCVFKLKLLIATTFLLLSLIFFKPVLISIIGKPEIKNAVVFGLILAYVGSFWRYILALLQSYERFFSYALINIIPNLSKILLILFLFSIKSLSLTNALIVNVFVVFLGFIIGFLLVPKDFILAKGNERNIALKLFQFSKWIIITNLIFGLYSRLDIFMLTYYKTVDAVGIYSVALSLMVALDLVYVSIVTKLFPQASKLTYKKEFVSHIKKSLGISLTLTIFLSTLFFIAEPLIMLAYSRQFFESILIFQILLVGVLFTVMFNPLLLILYARNKPHVLTIVYFTLLSASFCGNLIFIPRYGAIGAAIVVSATKVIGALLILFLAFREIFKLNSFPA